MMRSSSSGNKYNHQAMMVVVVVVAAVLSVMSPGVSAAVTGVCNAASFPDDDLRITCSFALLDKLMGESPVKKGGWYNTEECSDGTTLLYGFRFADEGTESGGCLNEAKNFIAYRDCYHRMGGQAWDAGCYLRFEMYNFSVGGILYINQSTHE